MARRKRLSEIVRSMTKAMEREGDRYKRQLVLVRLCEDEMARRFFWGSTIQDVESFALSTWPKDGQVAVRRSANRRGTWRR